MIFFVAACPYIVSFDTISHKSGTSSSNIACYMQNSRVPCESTQSDIVLRWSSMHRFILYDLPLLRQHCLLIVKYSMLYAKF